jgi:PEP-CTERM motif
MTFEKTLRLGIFLVSLAALPSIGRAGSVITTDLPANTAIVNINAATDGAASWCCGQTLWYQPFSTGLLPTYTVQPGTYEFRVVNPSDAAALYPSLTAGDLSQIYTAWTYNSPWITNYLAYDSSAITNSSIPQLFYGAPSSTGYGSASAAYSAALSDGSYDEIYAGSCCTGPLTSYTFATATTLAFVIPDNGLYDNTGGVSVLISPVSTSAAAPEPGSMAMLAGALAGLMALRRRANRGARQSRDTHVQLAK